MTSHVLGRSSEVTKYYDPCFMVGVVQVSGRGVYVCVVLGVGL